MSVRIYGLWPIGVDRLRFENRITATAAASTIEEARDIVVTAADQRGFRNPQMWLDPSRTCCEEVMEAGAIPNGFVALHYTPDWGVALPRRLLSGVSASAKAPGETEARAAGTGDGRRARDEKGRFIKRHANKGSARPGGSRVSSKAVLKTGEPRDRHM